MSRPVVVPRRMVERKPPHGSPCNRCGVCCFASLCPLGAALFERRQGPCPALRMDGELSTCGLVDDPAAFASAERVAAFGVEPLRTAAAYLVGAGDGCDARINGEPRREPFATDLDRRKERERVISLAAQGVWGVHGLEW